MKTDTSLSLKPASFGSVSTATLRDEDLIPRFLSELEWQISRNGDFLSRPENFGMRDRLARIVGNAQDAFEADGETLKEDCESETIEELVDALSEFAPAYGYFGAHVGDGADFGFWLGDIEEIKELVEHYGEFGPSSDFRGEWLLINERGNCTLFVREGDTGEVEHDRQWREAFVRDGYVDREIWSIV